MKHAVSLLVLATLVILPATAGADEPGQRVQIGEDIVVEADQTLQDAVCIGCSIRVLGTVADSAVAVGGNIEIDGTVGDNAVSVGGTIRLGPTAVVGDNVVASMGRVERDPKAQVGGEITSTPGLPIAGLGGMLLFGLLVALAVNLVVVLLVFLIAGERRVETIAGAVREHAGLALLTGVGVLVGAVILYVLSSLMGPITPILAILVSVALLVTLLVGYAGLSYWLGRSLAQKSAPLAAVLLGAVLITVLQMIPFVGFLLFLVFVLMAFGCAALSGYGTATDWLRQQFASRPPIPPPAR